MVVAAVHVQQRNKAKPSLVHLTSYPYPSTYHVFYTHDQ